VSCNGSPTKICAGPPPRSFPLGECEGDCDSNGDCQSGLICHKRSKYGPIPQGCSGSKASRTDYCVEPTVAPVPSPQKPPSGRLPLGECEGDCDTNGDCQSGLIFHKRNNNDPIPKGCSGSKASRTDYCVKPSVAPAPSPQKQRSGRLPLGECEGDCNTNGDCQSGLICHQRNNSDPSVRVRVKTSTITPIWSARYNEVEEFYTRHGHIKVPSRSRLASWLRWQRTCAKRVDFPAEKKELLDRLGFQWAFPVISSDWMARYNEARAYEARHGHLLQFPSRSPLANWIYKWRKEAKSDKCPPEKKRLLDKLGFEKSLVPNKARRPSTLEEPEIGNDGDSMEKRTPTSPSAESRPEEDMDNILRNMILQSETSTITPAWMARYNELKETYARQGNIRVSCGRLLSTWISRERRTKAKGGAYYPAEKKDLLDKLEFQWILPVISPAWMARYDELKVFKATHKHLDVPPGKGLGDWFRKERAKAKSQGYQVEKMELLETLGLKWREVIPPRLHRHAVIEEAESEDADDLAMTSNSVISPFTVPIPSEETDYPVPNKKALQDKPFTIDPTWMTWFNEAKEFHNRHGHLQVRNSENSRLYQWIKRQCRAQAKGGYPSEKKDLLDSLRVKCRIPVVKPAWMARYNEFKEFKARHGHLRVPVRHAGQLSKWIHRQRHAKVQGIFLL